MCKIKICGLTREQDIETVNKYMPEYVGFVFAKSRRQVDAHRCCQLIEQLNPRIKKVGVFVNMPLEELIHVKLKCNLEILQLHGDEDKAYIIELRDRLKKAGEEKTIIWKHVSISIDDHLDFHQSRMNIKKQLETSDSLNIEALLFDSFTNGERGGTGKVFDWKLLENIELDKKVILAGGLHEKNILDAIRIVKPWAVDVSSGVETDGVKDVNKIKAFIAAIRSYD